MIVRLKVAYINTCTAHAGRSFNSMIVRLKVIYPTTFFLRFFCFNSMIVRLKVTPPFELYIKMWRFNSMIVRLKERHVMATSTNFFVSIL